MRTVHGLKIKYVLKSSAMMREMLHAESKFFIIF